MDYKEKYEMALEGIQEILGSGEDSIKMSRLQLRLQGIFPELKESENEKMRKHIIEVLKDNFSGEDTDRCIAWLEKQGEQKPAEWSEKDETNLNDAIDACKAKYGNMSYTTDWLKSLKDRVQPQPNQEEWSEEDRITRNALINLVEMYYGGCINKSEKNRLLDWLKSLRPQNWTKEDKERYISCLQRLSTGNPEQPETINSKWFKEHVYPQKQWKPSDEQLNSLYDVLNPCDGLNRDVLESLYNDLKKLREG